MKGSTIEFMEKLKTVLSRDKRGCVFSAAGSVGPSLEVSIAVTRVWLMESGEPVNSSSLEPEMPPSSPASFSELDREREREHHHRTETAKQIA
jgi:hypothetical protein